MKVLIGCEYSGIMRDAFRARGHNAYSCDILPSIDDSPYHIQADVLTLLDNGWDMGIFHPDCTFLTNSGVKHLYIKGKSENGRDEERWRNMYLAAYFFNRLLNCRIPKVAVENPVMHSYAQAICGKPTQSIQPWMFGHGEVKRTCFWLRNLPKLKPTLIVDGRYPACWLMGPSKERKLLRAMTYPGIAYAAAAQWG